MKLFQVVIDNNPGSWKSGSDPECLVVAKDKEEAIAIIRSGKWGEKFIYENDCYTWKYGESEDFNKPYISKNSHISVCEIKIEGFVININSIRTEKLKRILK